MEKRLVPIALDNYRPLREIVFETLREAIINGTLKPGERLMEIQLAEEMGVSRTPVREAIRKLELEGLAVTIPRKGAYVSGITLKDVADLFEIRAGLESFAAGLAAERITEEEIEQLERLLVKISDLIEKNDLQAVIEMDTVFHDHLYKASRNERLVGIINNLREQIQRARAVSLASPGRLRFVVEEHRKIVEAISQRDVEAAQLAAKEHIESAENTMINAMSERLK